MFSPSTNFYAGWRAEGRAGEVLRDENDSPPERLLQAVWQHQRLQRDALKTADGKVVRIFHPGFASAEGGPDFRGAVLQIGDDSVRAGDVEVDLRASGWHAHGHDRNPHFRNVLLHVVWNEEVRASKSQMQIAPPMLALHHALDAPLGELSWWLENEPVRALPENLRGKCSAQLRALDETRRAELLRAAAQVRFQAKAAQFRARAKGAGWEQALWEGLFRALGYKHNAWPMQNLAETKPRWAHGAKSAFEFQARLLGISGLLPVEPARLRPAARDAGAANPAKNYFREIWDFWWRERDEFSDCVLPRAVWKFHGLRPANHPQRRLALAAHWLADETFISKIERWAATNFSGGAGVLTSRPAGTLAPPKDAQKFSNSLHDILQVARDEFWSWHWTFRSARLARPQPLLGDARVTDLAVNVVLPWLWVRAQEGGNERIQKEVERRFLAWPAAEDNSVLKLARQRLLGEGRRTGGPDSGAAARRPSPIFKTAAAQQGLMQIVRDFCERTNAICDDCRFPERLCGWTHPATV